MERNDVISKPKFLAFTGYQILLAIGLRCARLRRARELRYYNRLVFVAEVACSRQISSKVTHLLGLCGCFVVESHSRDSGAQGGDGR